MKKQLLYFLLMTLIIYSCATQKKNVTNNTGEMQLMTTKLNGPDTLIITTLDGTPFREKPDANSRILKNLLSDIILTSYETVGNYYKVKINDTTGYVPIAFVSKHTRDQTTQYTKSVNNQPLHPGSSNTSSSKACSTVQCSGTTQKGSRCRNRTTNCSGRCYLH